MCTDVLWLVLILFTIFNYTNQLDDTIALFDKYVNDYDSNIVYPRIFDTLNRRRRHINTNIYYEAKSKLKIIELGEWALVLGNEHNLITESQFQAEWISDKFTEKRAIRRCEYKSGVVSGLENTSLVAMTICESEITGYINTGYDSYFIEPLNPSTNSHVLYKNSHSPRCKKSLRSDNFITREWEFFNLTGDTIDIGIENEINDDENGGNDIDADNLLDTNVTSILWRKEDETPDTLGYFVDTAWETRIKHHKKNKISTSTLPPQWLEIALAVDYTVIGFHGRERVLQYILSLMNIVNAIYRDPSLDANMQLVITRLLLYESKKQSIIRIGDAKKSLQNINLWNRRLHMSLIPGDPRHDIAIWLTRSDLGGPSGYAPVGGTCDPNRSCTLNRDEGLTSAFIIAHEIAHLLGLSHDGDQKASNTCGGDAFHGSIMAAMISSTFHSFKWSDCSQQEFRKKTSKFTCLLNKPPGKGEIILNSTLHTTFSMDEQCRMEFGEGYSLCRVFDIIEICSHLWCGHVQSPLVCKTKKGPPLEGTECGFDKWCINGYCEPVDKRRFGMDPILYNPQDGEWGKWGLWGPCSRSCGTGVQFRTRKCDNPEPMYGGNNCFGLAEEWKICIKNPCPEPLKDLRAEQCLRLPKYVNFGSSRKLNMTWLPHESEEYGLKCKLICSSKETRELYITDENLIDGTPCSYESTEDICIQGVCHPLGCDGKLFSSVKQDLCGVCGGNNSHCAKVDSVHRKKLKRDVSRLAVLPRLAKQIKIEANFSTHISDPSVAFILKDRKKRSYTVTVPNIKSRNEIIEGTKFYYKKFSNEHNIWASGPLLAEMVILVFVSKTEITNGINVSYRLQYYVHRDMLYGPTRYKWIIGGWGPCSQSCGGGRRQKTAACFDVQNNKIIPRRHCSLYAKPSLPIEKCNNFSCKFHWIEGEWEPCSATCGSYGIQYRELYCVPQSVFNGTVTLANGTFLEQPWRYMVSPNKCGGTSPITSRSCHRDPCPSYWVYDEWSQCSASCGSGISVRHSYCSPPEGELFFTCGPSPPEQRKICNGQFTRANNYLCKSKKKYTCKGDQSEYCSLPVLSKYCKLRGFSRVCCKSCTKVSLLDVAE